MTTDLCPETAVVHLTTPQIITSESVVGVGVGGRAAGAGAGGGAVELGRRLLLAARAGDTQLVLDLMAKGAPFTTDWLGTSPLHLAASNAHVETCGVLLRAGVSRDSRTKVERTPLHLAAYAGHAQVVELLLEHGALVDCRDMLNMTPLHWAAERGHTAVAAALLRHGADARALTKYHKTAAQLAAARQHRALAALIHDALRQREAARSVRAIQPYRQAEETPEPQKPTFTAVHRIQEIKIKPKPVPEKLAKIESKVETAEAPSEATAEGAAESGVEGGADGGADGGAGGGAGGAGGALGAAALLRRHGITLLPADDGGTLLSALQSGRTVVLSDAGKLMLKESSEASPPAAAPAPAAAAPGAGAGADAGARGRGVVLTATPVRAPPPGVKVFTLNQRLRPAAAAPAAAPAPAQPQRITLDSQQVKFVQLASEGRAASPRAGRGRRLAAGARAPVKIIMNKTNFQRLVAGARRDADAPDLSTGEVATVASSKASTASERSLAAQLAAAQRTIATLTEELRVTRARLAQYEPPE